MIIHHVVNPFRVFPASNGAAAQPVTFTTMKIAHRMGFGKVAVRQFGVCYPEDEDYVREWLEPLPVLERSVLDIQPFQEPRKFPFLIDIVKAAHDVDPPADYIIYSNADIALMPYFYSTVTSLMRDGSDALVINRRTIPDKFKDLSELPLMYVELGKSHPGFDCFVFPRHMFPRMKLGLLCIGIPWVGHGMLANLIALSARLRVVSDLHLTFHLGDDREWRSEKFRDYHVHNAWQYRAIIGQLEDSCGAFDRSRPPASFLAKP